MKKLNLKAMWSWGSAAIGLLALMVQFQNCAPAGGGADSTNGVADQVRIVDDWNEKALVFPESYINLHDQTDEYVAQGLCPRKGEGLLQWVLFDESNSISTGTTDCEMGGFQVALKDLTKFKCGTDFSLQVFNEAGQEAKISIARKCAPLLAQESYTNKASSEICYLELDKSPYSMDPVCYQACYIGSRLAYREGVERDRCGSQTGG